MENGRTTQDDSPLCYEALLPWIPQLCELDVLEDWGRAHQLHFPSKGGKHRHTTTHHGITIDGVEEFVVRALHPAQRAFLRAPLTWSCVSQHGSIDPEPFSYVDAVAPASGASGGASFSAQLAVLTSLHLNDTIVEAVGSLIPSDQREKATKYVVCGHCDAETVVVQRAVHDDDSSVVLVTANITASQRDQVYSCRAAFRVDPTSGKCLEWLACPASKCKCVVSSCFCAHQLALVAFTAVLGCLSAEALPPQVVSKDYLRNRLPEPVLLMESIPMMTATAFLPQIKSGLEGIHYRHRGAGLDGVASIGEGAPDRQHLRAVITTILDWTHRQTADNERACGVHRLVADEVGGETRAELDLKLGLTDVTLKGYTLPRTRQQHGTPCAPN